MPRVPITLPESVKEWYALPKAFLDFVEQVDEARSAMEAGSYGSYRWDVDSDGPLLHLIRMWNDGDDLSPEEAVKAIQEGGRGTGHGSLGNFPLPVVASSSPKNNH